MTDVLQKLFAQHFRTPPWRVQPLRGQFGASGRKVIRLSSEQHTAIGILYDVREENVCFLEFSRHFRKYGLPVPEIYAEDLSQGAYLEEDLGDTTLFEFLSTHRAGADISPQANRAYRKVVSLLPRFQVEAGRNLNYGVCYPRAVFDEQSIAWDLNYFKYYFLKLAGIPFHEQSLEDDFRRLTRFLLTTKVEYFLYRDFQSRNIMLRGDEPFFLDYQGGRRGALQYDIASLLFDAKADLPPEVRQQLLDLYLSRLSEFVQLEREVFMHHYYAYVYARIMQALGAYGFRGFYERKPHFLQSVPYALKNLQWLLQNAELPISLPTLMEAFTNLATSEKLRSLACEQHRSPVPKEQNIVVRIYSFSYGRGVPKDETGHGGGFVFDARGIPNPGREEKFKSLTGKDAPVIEFLNRQESAHQFLAGVESLVNASVKNYQDRGFTSLTVYFGCTGGQHRSVYFAERLANHLSGRNGVTVIVRHLELKSPGK